MYVDKSDLKSKNKNPIDLLEDALINYNWPYNRTDNNTLFAEAKGNWCDYHLTLAWSQDKKILQYSWLYNIKITPSKYSLVYPLINKINLNLASGHLELWDEEGMIMYRNSEIACRNINIDRNEIDYILNSCLKECDKYYPAFQFVLWGKKSPVQALEASLLDTLGEA